MFRNVRGRRGCLPRRREWRRRRATHRQPAEPTASTASVIVDANAVTDGLDSGRCDCAQQSSAAALRDLRSGRIVLVVMKRTRAVLAALHDVLRASPASRHTAPTALCANASTHTTDATRLRTDRTPLGCVVSVSVSNRRIAPGCARASGCVERPERCSPSHGDRWPIVALNAQLLRRAQL